MSRCPRRRPLNEAKSIDQALAEAFLKADRLEAPLPERLKLYLGESRELLPELEATYDQLVARIADNIRSSNQVPAVSEALPAFCLTDSQGKLVGLAALLDNGPLVISFNRGPWCDYCGLELHSLARAHPEIVAAGGDVVSIVPGDRPICAQPSGNARGAVPRAHRHGSRLCPRPGARVLGRPKDHGHVPGLRHRPCPIPGKWRWFLPIPATLVVGRDGRVKARIVDPDFRHRMRTEDIVEAVREAARG